MKTINTPNGKEFFLNEKNIKHAEVLQGVKDTSKFYLKVSFAGDKEGEMYGPYVSNEEAKKEAFKLFAD
jgi:hypothetical protein